MSSINLQLKLKKSEKFPLKYKVIKRYKERHSFIVGCLFQYCYIKRDDENYLSIQLQDIENQRDVIIDNLYAKEDLLKQYEIYYNSLEKILNSFSDIISVIAIFL